MTQEEMIALRARVTETLREMVAKENEYLKQQNADLRDLLDYIADETHPKKWKKAIDDIVNKF
tara:strand:- start:2776 stop:2964 length:189 start_codon:yes stop_codon:yes gene_type:complete